MRLMLFTVLLLLIRIPAVSAQNGGLTMPVSVHYDRIPLRQAFNDLERRYPIRFSYSSDHIPLNHRVSVHREQAALSEVLDDLFADTHIVYARIGRQIVLKHDPNKPIRNPWQERSTGMQYREPVIEVLPIGSKTLRPMEVPSGEEQVKSRSVVVGPEDQAVLTHKRYGNFLDSLNVGMPPDKRVYQVSVFPPFGSNGWESSSLTNLYSVNLLAGHSAGVEGAEVSLLLNATQGRVKGLQAAVFANVSEGDMYGRQLAAGFNATMERARGLQASLFLNAAGEMTGTQLALGANFAGQEFRGRQIAGLFNVAGGNGAPESLQLASAFNLSSGEAGAQIGLINMAGRVERSQIGLINMADSVGRVSIGLVNFIRKGYNHLEVGASESLWAHAALKLGTRGFYNVFYGGIRWGGPGDEDIWGLGYGIGTNFTLSRRLDLNLEGLSIHLSKGRSLVHQLNLLNQMRLTLDWRLAKHFGFFAGGSLNLMVSRVADTETGKTGYDIAPYTWYQTTTQGGTAFQAWAGFSAGLRF